MLYYTNIGDRMKRGFTLIEIMGVIIIIGIIGLIVVVSVDKTIRDNKEKMYQLEISNIEGAARTWGVKNISYLPDEDGKSISIPLIVLKQNGLIDKDIINPKNETLFYNNMYIDIIYRNGNYIYDVVEESGSEIPNDLDVPIIIFFDSLNIDLVVDEELKSKGIAILRDGNKLNLDSSSSYLTKDTNLDLNSKGTYDYSIIINDGKSFTATRKITVK